MVVVVVVVMITRLCAPIMLRVVFMAVCFCEFRPGLREYLSVYCIRFTIVYEVVVVSFVWM